MTSPEKEVLKTKICCGCGKEKDIKHFYKNALLPTGYEKRCKICKNSRVKCKKGVGNKRGRPQLKNQPQLWNVRKKDWVDTYEFLKSIGYDLNKNIHEQFCEKHNLPTRKRMKEKSLQYSPQDLGLV